MEITRVQSKTAASNSTTAPTITLNSTPTPGNIIVMAVGVPTSLWIPPAGNIDWLIFPFTVSASRTGMIAVGAVRASPSATITLAQPSGASAIVAAEYSGLGGVFHDRQMAASGNSTSPASGAAATTTDAVELWVGCLFGAVARTDTSTFFSSPTNSFAIVGEVNSTLNTASDRTVALTERIVSATGAPNTGATAAISGVWVASVLALRIVPGGGLLINPGMSGGMMG